MSPDELKPHELLKKFADFLAREGIRYRIVGSMASIIYGEPRFTNDIDVLVELTADRIEALEKEFQPPDFYFSSDAALDAIQRRHQFNILHIPSGLKVDVIQCKGDEFGQLDIQGGQRIQVQGLYDAWFASPENVILMKLRYFQDGGSEKHLRDITGILKIQKDRIDLAYLDLWAERLKISTEWQNVRDAALGGSTET